MKIDRNDAWLYRSFLGPIGPRLGTWVYEAEFEKDWPFGSHTGPADAHAYWGTRDAYQFSSRRVKR